MTYFDERFLGFFEGLAIDNSKTYFDERRKLYKEAVRAPFLDLVRDLIVGIREYEPDLAMEPKDAVFRINRDIRFSRDKSPYKTHVGAHISARGRMDMGWPAFYVQLSHEKVMVAGGSYQPSGQEVQRIRQRIASDPQGLSRLLDVPAFKEVYGGIEGEALKRVPREFQETFEVQPLVANKEWYFMADLEPERALREDLFDVLIDHYVAGHEVSEYIRDALRRV